MKALSLMLALAIASPAFADDAAERTAWVPVFFVTSASLCEIFEHAEHSRPQPLWLPAVVAFAVPTLAETFWQLGKGRRAEPSDVLVYGMASLMGAFFDYAIHRWAKRDLEKLSISTLLL